MVVYRFLRAREPGEFVCVGLKTDFVFFHFARFSFRSGVRRQRTKNGTLHKKIKSNDNNEALISTLSARLQWPP
jgi:hypothetical protein